MSTGKFLKPNDEEVAGIAEALKLDHFQAFYLRDTISEIVQDIENAIRAGFLEQREMRTQRIRALKKIIKRQQELIEQSRYQHFP